MALFGKKSNPQSGNTEVPPELKPYYTTTPGRGSAARRAALRAVFGLLVAAILITGGLALWRYARNHPISIASHNTHPNSTQKAQSTNSTPKASGTNNTNAAPSSSPSPSDTGTTPAPTTSQQASPTQTSTAPASNTPPVSTSTNVSTDQTGASGTSQNTALTNTGPGDTMFVAVLAATVFGTLVQYRRQLKSNQHQ